MSPEGPFYYLNDYLDINASGVKFKSLKQKVEYATEHLGKDVIKDRSGHLGIRANTFPSKAAYKYMTGSAESVTVVTADMLDDATETDSVMRTIWVLAPWPAPTLRGPPSALVRNQHLREEKTRYHQLQCGNHDMRNERRYQQLECGDQSL